MIPLTTKSRSAIRIFLRSLETTHSVMVSVPLEDAGQHRNGHANAHSNTKYFFLFLFRGIMELSRDEPTAPQTRP